MNAEPFGERMNLLLVDDQPAGLEALAATLEPLGHRLVQANSGSEALRRLLHEPFAVVLLDVQMPGMDGYETATLIRARDRTRTTPIVFLTAGYGSEAQVMRGYDVGAVDFMLKPVVPEILRSKISVLIELAQKTAQLTHLAESRAALLASLQAKNAELVRARASLEGMNAELEAFSYAVSHDLRAPLRHIGAFGQLLVDQCAASLEPPARGYVDRMLNAAERMDRLVEALLALSRATRAPLARQQVDLTAVAAAVVDDLRKSDPAREVDVAITDGLTADGDPALLRAVLDNLIGNAWKYSARQPQTRIEFGAVAGEDGGLAYFVRDNGAGFDMEYAHKLFAPFQRLHSPAEFEGTGIGLATVRRIVRRHGGRVWAEGEKGKGATFSFTLADASGAATERGDERPGF